VARASDLPSYTLLDRDGLRWRVFAAGPAAAYLEAEAAPSPGLTRRLAAQRAGLWRTRPRSVHDLVPAYCSLLAEFRAGAAVAELVDWLRTAVDAPDDPLALGAGAPEAAAGDAGATRAHHRIRVAYGAHADREALERASGRSFDALVAEHAAASYTVAFIGFTPGFPYLLGLPPGLALPRRERPAARIPAGAVAIAGAQAGIYPSASPGGWWVLGITDARLFDVRRDPTALLASGDTVRFVPTPPEALERLPPLPASAPPAPLAPEDAVLRIDDIWPGAATLQAGPRAAVGHLGMAQAGALDQGAFQAAQEIVGASRHSAALELVVPHLTLDVLHPTTLVVTGGGADLRIDGHPAATWRAHTLRAGARIQLRPASGRAGGANAGGASIGGATTYLAVAGGVRWPWHDAAHPDLHAVQSTDLRAGLGRALRRGDALAVAGPPAAARAWVGRPRYAERAYLRVHPGPQHDAEALDALMASRWRLATRDRTGARLDGPPLALGRHEVVSQGVPLGAVQVPADGRPLVLLADRGRTGGYAVPAVVDPRDLWQLAQAGSGSEVWFLPPDWRR